jgi:glycosyltransferase involved in cell wall biosynthesis
MSAPLYSIITPVFNTEAYLRECIDSCLSQTMPELEMICINDGSTDSSLAILQEYAAKDSRVRVLSQENCGYAKSANRGIHEAQGEWVMFVDSDDVLEPDACEVLLNAARESGANMVVGDSCRFIGNGADRISLLKRAFRPKEPGWQMERRLLPGAVWLYHGALTMWAAIYKRDHLLQEEIFCDERTRIFSDHPFSIRFSASPKTLVYYEPRTVYLWRQDNPLSTNRDSKREEAKMLASRLAWKYLDSLPYQSYLRNALHFTQFGFFCVDILVQNPTFFGNHLSEMQERARSMRSQPGFRPDFMSEHYLGILNDLADDAQGFFDRWIAGTDFAKNHQKIVLQGELPAVLEMGGRLAGLGHYGKILAYAFPDGEEPDPLFPLRLAMVRLEERPLWRAEQIEALADGAFVKNC